MKLNKFVHDGNCSLASILARHVLIRSLLIVTLFMLIQPPRGILSARNKLITAIDHHDSDSDNDNDGSSSSSTTTTTTTTNNNNNRSNSNPNQNHGHIPHNYRHYQETTSDTTDGSSQDASDQLPDEAGGSSDLAEDRLPPPNELSVIRMNDTSVVLRWEFPENSQEHLQFFKVQHKSTSRKNGTDSWKTDSQEIPTTTRAYQINGLRPGNFLFSVVAVYDNDDNVSSTPYKFKIRARSKIKPKEMPEMKAPHIYWTEAQSDYFRFKWKYDPKDNDTEYFGFLVFYRSAHAVSDFTIYNTMDTSVEIAEVESDTPYEAKVVAYNMVGVSEFSETISIRTKPRQNASSSAATESPSIITTTTSTTSTFSITSGLGNANGPLISTSTTRRPSFPSMPTVTYNVPANTVYKANTSYLSTPKPSTSPPVAHNSTDIYQSFISLFEPIFVDQSDAMLIVRYLLLVLLPLLFIIIVLIFVIKPHKGSKKKGPSESSMQFDLEINGYFKNSFPGVEKEYPSVCINVHNGFVNNHPHIDDST